MFEDKLSSRYAKNVSKTYSIKRWTGFQILSIKYWLIPIIVIALLVSAYSYYSRRQAEQFTPEKLFAKTFTDSPEQVSDLKGESTYNLGLDDWIRFKYPTSVHLRKAEEFKPSIAEVGRRWFEKKLPDDRALTDSADEYQYVVRSEHTISGAVNEGLLINKKSHDYFYRTWGM